MSIKKLILDFVQTYAHKLKRSLVLKNIKKIVEFMKALKSKEMMISQVLQSIVRLFSGPERLHLLERYSLLFDFNTIGGNCPCGYASKILLEG